MLLNCGAGGLEWGNVGAAANVAALETGEGPEAMGATEEAGGGHGWCPMEAKGSLLVVVELEK